METIAIRTTGGPYEGTRLVKGQWPPPDSIDAPGFEQVGAYHIKQRSKLADVIEGVVRGAEYKWEDHADVG